MVELEATKQQMMEWDEYELNNFRDAFSNLDTKGVGKIRRTDLKQALKNVGEKASEAQISMTMQRIDLSSEGDVSFSEFLTLMSRIKASQSSASLHKVGPTIGEGGQADGISYHSYSQEEKHAFAEHINNCLKDDQHVGHRLPMDLESEQLFSECEDGLLLCKLINCAEYDTIDVRALNVPTKRKPLLVFHKVENMNLALNAAKSIGCVITNINAKDIIDGNPILILGIIWQIIRIQLLASISLTACPEIVALLDEEEDLDDLLAMQPESILLRWFNHHLENAGSKRKANNFGPDLADSELLSIVLNQLDPSRCDLCNEQDHTQRAAHVIRNAKALGVETFLQPTDIVSANRKLLLAFVAQLFNTTPGLQVPQEKIEEVVANFASLDLDDAGDTREEKVFRMWINSLGIDNDSLYINNLFIDLADGVAILKVMDRIQPGVVNWKRVNMKPKNRFKKVENGNYVVETAKVMSLSVVNVGGLDIVDVNKKLILAVVWQLMRQHTLNLLSELPGGKKGGRVDDSEVLRWANKKVSRDRIKAFSDHTLSTGIFLLRVCHSVRSGLVNWELVESSPNSTEDKLNNAKYAISVARKMGALVFLAPEDIVEVRSRMLMLFCASIWHTENKINEAKMSEEVAKDIDMTAKDVTEVAMEYLDGDSDDDSSEPVVVGKLDDEYLEVVEEEKEEVVVATDEAREVEDESVHDIDVAVTEPTLSTTPERKMEAAPQAAIERPQGTTVIGNEDTKDEWDTGS